MRDYGFSNVFLGSSGLLGSSGWRLRYYFDRLPHGEYHDQDAKGLYVQVQNEFQLRGGNYIELSTTNRETVEAFVKARSMFYNKDNSDFHDQTYSGKSFGFKYL